jgi:hypothetical protein
VNKKPDVIVASLMVNRVELLEGLRRLKRHVRTKKPGQGTFRFQSGKLHVDLEGLEIAASGVGRWSGEAVVPGTFVLAFASNTPDVDPIPVRVEGRRLNIAGASINCLWLPRADSPAEPVAARAPVSDATLLEILKAAGNQSDEALEKTGFLALARDARSQREARIAEAAQALEPLGVPRDLLSRLVDECILRVSPPA